MFCAEELLRRRYPGYLITILERGDLIDRRDCPEDPLCRCPSCSILEGVGGAGGLSDGKLTFSVGRGVQTEKIFSKSAAGFIKYLSRRFEGQHIPAFSSSDESTTPLYDGSPCTFTKYPLMHIGSDGIREFIRRQMWELVSQGVTFIRAEAEDLHLVQPSLRGIGLSAHRIDLSGAGLFFPADFTVIATGLAGTGWWEKTLRSAGVGLSSGPAGFGLRVEADEQVLEPLFSRFYDWKVEMPRPFAAMRSFCCNSGGSVVNEKHQDCHFINVNGHSFFNSDLKTRRSNFAIIAKLPISSVITEPQEFVRSLAKSLNGDPPMTKVQALSDFMQGFDTSRNFQGTNAQAAPAEISGKLPPFLRGYFREFLTELSVVCSDLLTSPTAVIYGPEVKYYGYKVPVVPATWEVLGLKGVYSIGNASGYLDSYIAAAVSGMQAACHIENEFSL
jgi:hypothetical protein